jgi:hypothetical protein
MPPGDHRNADVDAYEATRDIEKSWSKRMKATHMPVYAAYG